MIGYGMADARGYNLVTMWGYIPAVSKKLMQEIILADKDGKGAHLCKEHIWLLNYFVSDAKERADKVLEEWDDICKELNVDHFLILGTCLGFVRDKGYIKEDHDIDVGVRPENFSAVSRQLVARGFILVDNLGYGAHFWKDHIWLDVLTSTGNKFLTAFDKVSYNGRIYDIPHPVEQYLEFQYGKDWKIPQQRTFTAVHFDSSILGLQKVS